MLLNKYELTIKKSKFISLCFKVKSAEDVSNILETIKKENKKAT